MTETICVCGAGTMGSGIAQLAAQSGFKTIQFDVDKAMIERSKSALQKNLQSLVNKGCLTENEMTSAAARIIFTNDISECKADVIIEAIIEKKDAKVDLFKQLANINTKDSIYASNTSSLSISQLAAELKNPDKVIGMHFFNPARVMKLVEVVKGKETGDEVVEKIVILAKALGKTAVVCKDVPGFIVNRVARPYYLEAMKLIEEGIADVETIDSIMEASGFKMGPFKLMDLIGMDINYSVSSLVWEALDKPARLTPSFLQQQKVDAGELGKKTGKGFYSY